MPNETGKALGPSTPLDLHTRSGYPNYVQHILYITACGEAGVADYLRMMSEGLSSAGIRVTVAGPAHSRFACDIKQLSGVRFLGLPLKKRIAPVSDLFCALQLRRIIAWGHFDVIHSNSSKAGLLVALAKGCADSSVFVYSPHCTTRHITAFGPLRHLFSALEKWSSRRHDLLISGCRCEQAELIEADMNRPGSILAVYYGVEMPGEQSRSGVRPVHSANTDRAIVGTMARLVPQKGVDLLIRTVSTVASVIPNVRYIIAGDGPMERKLRSLAKDEGVADRVEFVGYVDDCHTFLAGLDVFVLPSRWEGLPLVVLLAGSVGTPVISFDVGGVSEVIDGQTGWLVPNGDVPALAKAIVGCLSDRNEAQRRGAHLGKTVRSRFRVEHMVRETYDAYCSAKTAGRL